MGVRRKSREAALQLLYQAEFEDPASPAAPSRFWAERKEDAPVREYADQLFRGIVEHRAELDRLIQSASKNWRMARMGLIDRNILRLAVYEMRFVPGVAPAVAINEALEIAKKYSGQEASVFINGVLDGIRKALDAGPAPAGKSRAPKERKKEKEDEQGQEPGTARRGTRRTKPE